MKKLIEMLGCCVAVIALLISPSVQTQSEGDPPTDRAVRDPTNPALPAAGSVQTANAQLGEIAIPKAAQDWRIRRIHSRARVLARSGVEIRESELDDLVVVGSSLEEVTPELVITSSELKGGHPTTSLLSVGMLLGGKSEATAYSRCTVTLTKPDTVITARHCLAQPHGDSFWVYFPYGGIRRVVDTGISFFCSDDDPGCSISVDDLAIATLDTPYAILPPSIAGTAGTASPGQRATIVGFGLSSPDLADYGIKRQGTVQLAACNHFPTDGLSLCFEYVEEIPPSEIERMENNDIGIHVNCNNDSGGPMLTPAISWERVIGVASQLAGSCDGAGEGRYVNATNTRYQSWLKSAYCQPTCINNPNVVLSQLVAVPIDYLSENDPSRTHQLVIASGTDSLIVTLNHGRGWFPFPNNLNLELPSNLNPTCVQFVEVEVCKVDAPMAGTYNAVVTRVKGEAEYQLSAVAFAAVPEPQ